MRLSEFPIYIVSRGRWRNCYTARALNQMGVPFRVIIESDEFEHYLDAVGEEKLLVLPDDYRLTYDTFDSLGLTKGLGPGPARNFAWEHSLEQGAKWHWVMDDNIPSFHRFNHNLKVPVSDGTIFRCMEEFVLRYANVAMAGPNYFKFITRKSKHPAYTLNTRIYSCNLIRNDVPFRWRGRYNEDTDLSLRMLKAGWCTVLFNAFLQDKMTTQRLGGGNTREFYAKEGTLPKSKMLLAMHPDVTQVVWKFSRWHHTVNYSIYKQKLIRRSGVAPTGVDNFGMRLITLGDNAQGKSPARTSRPGRRPPSSSSTSSP